MKLKDPFEGEKGNQLTHMRTPTYLHWQKLNENKAKLTTYRTEFLVIKPTEHFFLICDSPKLNHSLLLDKRNFRISWIVRKTTKYKE